MSRAYQRLLDFDPVSQTRTVFYKEADGTYNVRQESEVDPVLEIAKEEYKTKERSTPYGDMDLVARIPMVIWQHLERKGITKDQKALARWLDDPDNRAFRTRPGKLAS